MRLISMHLALAYVFHFQRFSKSFINKKSSLKTLPEFVFLNVNLLDFLNMTSHSNMYLCMKLISLFMTVI